VELAPIISILSLAVAGLAATCAIFSALASTRSARAAEAALALNREALTQNKASSEKSAELTKKMFMRQGVIDLHMAWQGVADLDPNNIVVPDFVRAVNAVSLTATLWNHSIIERVILYQNYWRIFDTLFRRLDSWEKPLPHLKVPGKEFLTAEIRRAHKEMHDFHLGTANQTSL
jgi:hypothetical protein